MTRIPSRFAGPPGATLVEILVSTTFVGLVAALIYTFTQSCVRSIHAQQARSDAQDTAHAALEAIARDLRQAGYSASGLLVLGISSATATRVEMRSDWNGDGDFADASETIAYAEDATRGTLTRASGGSSPQPLIDYLVTGSLRFRYYDQANVELVPSGSGLDAAERAAVRRVDVTFTVAVPSQDPHLREPIRASVGATVGLRNAPSP